MDLKVDLDRAELAYVTDEVARLRQSDPEVTAEVFVGRMTKKMVGHWVSEERKKALDAIQTDVQKMTHQQRDEALKAFRQKVDELTGGQDVIR